MIVNCITRFYNNVQSPPKIALAPNGMEQKERMNYGRQEIS